MQVHIVYMGERPQGDFSVSSTHHSMLERVLGRYVATLASTFVCVCVLCFFCVVEINTLPNSSRDKTFVKTYIYIYR
jgi:hypothetical protein